MMQLPPPNAWSGIEPALAEARYARQIRLLNKTEEAIAAQQRIIDYDGRNFSHSLAMDSLIRARNGHEAELQTLLAMRQIETIDFGLEGHFFDEHRAPISKLGNILELLQELFTRVCQSRLEPRPKSHIKPSLAYGTQLFATAAYEASFGLRLVVKTQTDIEGSSLILNALETTFGLLNNENPAHATGDVGIYAIRKYRNLINQMIKAGATPKVSWHTPSGSPLTWKTSKEQLNVIANRLAAINHEEKKIHTLTGTLAGASLLRHKFEFVGENGVMTGRMPIMLHSKVSNCFNKLCAITVEETSYIDEATDTPKRHIQLLDIDLIPQSVKN